MILFLHHYWYQGDESESFAKIAFDFGPFIGIGKERCRMNYMDPMNGIGKSPIYIENADNMNPIFHHTCTRLQNAGKGIPLFQKPGVKRYALKPFIYLDYCRTSDRLN
jgi:hypothetical protein